MKKSLGEIQGAFGAGAQTSAYGSISSVRSRARLLQEAKEFDAAVGVWQQFIQQHPQNAEAMNELGSVFLQASRTEEGLTWFRRALGIRSNFPLAKLNLGFALRHLNRLEEAVSTFNEVVTANPNDGIACFHLGLTLHLLGRKEEALPWLKKACDLCPGHVESAHELGKVLQALSRKEEAIEAFRRTISLKPDCIDALLSLGGLLQEAKLFEEAAVPFQRVVDLDANHFNAWLGLGAALLGARRHAESLAAFRRALAIQPGSSVAYCNMALPLASLGRIEEAIDACRKTLVIEPGSPIATFNLGTMLLARGEFREGWKLYDYRFAMGGNKWLREDAHAAPWTGESLKDKTFLVLGEQANGDQIQFARYVPALSNLGAGVSYVVPGRLHRLFRTLPGSITLLSEVPPNSRFDFQSALVNLPGIFEQLGLPISNKTPYLEAEPTNVTKWKKRLGEHGFQVGIFWQGNNFDKNDLRSYPLAALRPLSAIPSVRLISLQIGGGTEQLLNLPPDMTVERLESDFDAGEDAFIDAAAVLQSVDLVVTCDTSIAHLAGALGRPTWIALTQFPEWRWQHHRSDSIWYPTARLFRQEAPGDWDGVFLRMADALGKLVGQREMSQSEMSICPKLSPLVEVSWGELLDKISILEIKSERMASSASLANVRRELEHLKSVLADVSPIPLHVEKTRAALRVINEKLWELEDAIRLCEAESRFDSNFIELARSIYASNDERAKLKRQINLLMKSQLVEEKHYRSEEKMPEAPQDRIRETR
jgi:tetratricopeptide (TPR) repeat protein